MAPDNQALVCALPASLATRESFRSSNDLRPKQTATMLSGWPGLTHRKAPLAPSSSNAASGADGHQEMSPSMAAVSILPPNAGTVFPRWTDFASWIGCAAFIRPTMQKAPTAATLQVCIVSARRSRGQNGHWLAPPAMGSAFVPWRRRNLRTSVDVVLEQRHRQRGDQARKETRRHAATPLFDFCRVSSVAREGSAACG